MTKQVFLHMGAHKTGTTTLQAELALNRDVLNAAGLVYPNFKDTDSHYQWARCLAGEISNISALEHKQVTADWLRSLQSGQALLLSAESFYRHINTQKDYLAKLKSELIDASITPVLCLRRQADYAKSLYGEWVMNWHYQYDIYSFIKEFYHWFNFESIAEQLSQLGRPILMSYHQIAGSNLSANFLKALGYGVTLKKAGTYLRASHSDAEIYLKQCINAEYPQLKFRAITTEVVNKFVSIYYPELKVPMPELIWHGSLSPSIFERSFKMSNLRLSQKFDFNFTSFFSPVERVSFAKIDTKILSLLAHVHREIQRDILNRLNDEGIIK